MINISGSNYIAGKKSKKGKEKFTSINPKTNKKGKINFYNATKEEIDKAVNEAEICFSEVSNYSDKKIASFLKTLSKEIINLGNQLIDVCDKETALGENRLINERTRTCNQLEMFAEFVLDGSYLEAIADNKKEGQPDIRRMLLPLGTVAVFPASNFPFAFGVCGGDTASAFAAKCPVIVKAHPLHPETSELFSKAVYKSIEKNNFPKGFFSLVHGNKKKVGEQIVLNSKIKAVGFTGSASAGRALFDLASKRKVPIPVYAEMGSVNPIFITKKAMEKRNTELASEISASITLGSGQFCTKPGLIFLIDNSFSNIFIEKLSHLMKEKDPGILISNRIKKGLEKTVKVSNKIDGAELSFGGKPIKNKTSFQNTLFITDSKTFLKEKQIQKEHFGPAAFIVKCKNLDEFLKISEHLEGQLTATIDLERKDYKQIKPLLHMLKRKAGRLIINGVPTGVRVCNAMQHGGPYPATTYSNTTSVGMQAIKRFLRPVCFQDFPDELLPNELKRKKDSKNY